MGIAFQTLGGDGIGYIIPVLVLRNFLDSLEQNGNVYRGLPELPFKGFELRNQSLRRYLQVPEGTTGVVIRNVAPAIAALLQEDDVITRIDDKVVGDDVSMPRPAARTRHAQQPAHATPSSPHTPRTRPAHAPHTPRTRPAQAHGACGCATAA